MKMCFTIIVVLFLTFSSGCQTAKWSMPKFPSLGKWGENSPKWFGKKDKEALAPPSQHFDETEPEIELAHQSPSPSTNGSSLPSKSLEPFNGTSKSEKPSGSQAAFQSPPVAGFDSSKNPGIRSPYEYKSASNGEQTKREAETLMNHLKESSTANIGQPTGQEQSDFDNSFSPANSLSKTQKSAPIASAEPRNLLQPMTNPAHISNNQTNSASNFSMNEHSPVPTGKQAVADQMGYPRTAQWNSGFQTSSPKSPSTSNERAQGSTSAEPISNALSAHPVTKPAMSPTANESTVEPPKKIQEYTPLLSDTNDFAGRLPDSSLAPQSFGSPRADVPGVSSPETKQEVARLPDSLKVQGGFKPGSTRRSSMF